MLDTILSFFHVIQNILSKIISIKSSYDASKVMPFYEKIFLKYYYKYMYFSTVFIKMLILT